MKMISNEHIKLVDTRVFYLRMNVKPAYETDTSVSCSFTKLFKPVLSKVYLQYYSGVGAAYNWLDRLLMPADELNKLINAANTDIFVYKINNEIAGFAEFVRTADNTEIKYFGLFPAFVGKGYGKQFLQVVVNEAWSNHPKHIQLNTCKLDHPNALSNYQKAGFVWYDTKTEQRKVIVQ